MRQFASNEPFVPARLPFHRGWWRKDGEKQTKGRNQLQHKSRLTSIYSGQRLELFKCQKWSNKTIPGRIWITEEVFGWKRAQTWCPSVLTGPPALALPSAAAGAYLLLPDPQSAFKPHILSLICAVWRCHQNIKLCFSILAMQICMWPWKAATLFLSLTLPL